MVSLQSPPIVKHHHPSLQSPPRVKHHHPSPRLQKWPDSTWPSTSKVHIALRMKTKIILSFKAAFKSLLAPSFYSIYYSPLFSLFAECAVPSAKTPICSTLSNSHCYPKLLPDRSLKSLQMPLPTGNFPWLLQKREESHIGYSIPSSTHSPGSTGHHTWNRSMQGKHFSSLMHHSTYHTVPAHLISAVRISFGLYHGGF